MKDSSDLIKGIWEGMLDADMNVRYFAHLSRRYTFADRCLKIFVAVTSSGSVASWQIWGAGGFSGLSWLWEVGSGAAALVAVAMPIVDLATRVQVTATLAARWRPILHKYELLWASRSTLDHEQLLGSWKEALEDEAKLGEQDAAVPRRVSLVRRSQTEVRRARGI